MQTRVLLRATKLEPRIVDFADRLELELRLPVTLLLDPRHGDEGGSRDIIWVSKANCEALGLHCPENFPYFCGDYGVYLARQAHPADEVFWLIEHDVYFKPGSLRELVERTASTPDLDLAGTNYAVAPRHWWWRPHASGLGVRPYRCLFPLVRFSARAIDALLDKRRAHSHSTVRRWLWPNDEGFVATTLSNGGFACRDINDFGRSFYDAASFAFGEPLNLQDIASDESELSLFHPVFEGEEYERRLARKVPAPDAPAVPSWAGRAIRTAARLSPW